MYFNNNFIAWEKTDQELSAYFEKTLLKGLVESSEIIQNVKLPRPPLENRFMYSYWLNITDWYENFEYWKHVMHKGNAIENNINFRGYTKSRLDI